MTDQRTNSEARDNLFDRQAINILENMASAFFALDRNWCFAYINSQAEVLLQRSRQELLRKNIWEAFPETVGSILYQESHRAIQEGRNTVFEEFYPALGLWCKIHLCVNPEHLAIYLQDITTSKNTQLELRSRNHELQTLQRISEITLSTESFQIAFQEIVEEISRATAFPIVAIELYDAESQMMTFMGNCGIPVSSDKPVLKVPVNQTLSGTVATTGQSIVKHYAPDETKTCSSNETLGQLSIKTFICMPMLVHQRVLGVLSLAHSEWINPDEAFLAWIASLAGYIAALIDRRQAEVALRLQSERERMLGAIAQRIHQSLDLPEILNTTVAEVRQFLQADRVIILRFESDWSAIVEEEAIAPGWRSLLGNVIVDSHFLETHGQHYQTGTVRATHNIYTAGFSQCYVDFLSTLQLKAKLVAPIFQSEQLWGLLIVHHCADFHIWQSWELEFLQHLATQLEIAIQQSELYSQIQQLNTDLEQQVQDRTAELQQALHFEALLKRITDKVRDSLDERQILETAVKELALGLELQCCDAGIYSAEQTISTIVYEYTKVLKPLKGFSFVIAESPIPEVFPHLFQGQYCHFCNLYPDSLRPGQQQFTALACPIGDDSGVIGDMWLFKDREDVFSDMEIRLVQQVVNQCAIALRQARLYQTAQAQVRELERLNRLKDDFLSTVSHELRTPMSSIKMASQMLEILMERAGLLDSADSQFAQYFQILNSECKREISLINDLLDLARLDADTEPLMLTEIDLSAWIPHISEVYIERTRQQQQQLQVDIPADLPSLVTDLQSLERILSELLHNACKYTPAGETITLSAGAIWKVENVRQTQPDHPSTSSFVLHLSSFQISVTNSGVEIPASERRRVFDKFYRIPNNDPWKHGGTGLGLALVKKLVERLHGTIEVQSYNRQTSFTIVLPQQSLEFATGVPTIS